MTCTPQTNATLDQIAKTLERYDDIVVCGHISPDGDCLGSQLALMHALRSRGKRVVSVLADEDPALDPSLSFLPGFDELTRAADYTGTPEVFVGVDVPTVERIGAAAPLHARSKLRITIDHHAVDTTMADLVHVDPDAASTTVLIWQLAGCLQAERDAALATCVYAGLCTDTGRFQFQNTDARALGTAAEAVAAGANPAAIARELYQSRRLASLILEGRALERMMLLDDGQIALSWIALSDFEEAGAVKADAEPLIDVLRSISGVRVACMLREQGETVRGSFRAKDDTDVSVLARQLGGGGHKAAAGFTLDVPLEQAIEVVAEQLSALVGATREGVRK